MTEHPEHPERAEVENRDPATTAVLERIIVPDHAPDFWDELALDMGDDDATVIVDRRFARWSTPRSTQRLLLAAAVVLVLLVGTAVLTTLPGTGGDQSIDAGPTADGDGDSGPDGVPPPSRSQIGGDDAQWFFSNRMAWTGDEFVAGFSSASDQSDDGYWSSPDGVDWQRRNGQTPALVDPFVCPTGYRCEVSPTMTPIPYHYAQSQYEVMARTADTLLLRASVLYSIDGVNPATAGQEMGPGPELHPDLLTAAAATDPCFAEVQTAGRSGGDGEGAAFISRWGSGGLDDPLIQLTCQKGGSTATFTVDLREQLTAEQIERVFSSGLDSELWVERPGSAAVRVTDAPSSSYWADGVPGGVVAQQVADIRSSGDRFWAAADGTVVTSTDGVVWTPVDVPTGEPSGTLEPTRVEASPGGHILVRLSTDRRDWNDDRWFSVSHDDGRSWSTPFEVPAELGSLSYQTDVGAAGVAVIAMSGDDSEPWINLSLIDGDSVRFTAELPRDSCCESVAVGDDRVILRANETLSIYLLDGTLTHETVFTGETDGNWFGRQLGFLLLVAILAIAAVGIGFVVDRIRRLS